MSINKNKNKDNKDNKDECLNVGKSLSCPNIKFQKPVHKKITQLISEEKINEDNLDQAMSFLNKRNSRDLSNKKIHPSNDNDNDNSIQRRNTVSF